MKQFLFGMIPDRNSSHLTEAITSGCGYASNDAYLSDLDEGTVLVAAEAFDHRDPSVFEERGIHIAPSRAGQG